MSDRRRLGRAEQAVGHKRNHTRVAQAMSAKRGPDRHARGVVVSALMPVEHSPIGIRKAFLLAAPQFLGSAAQPGEHGPGLGADRVFQVGLQRPQQLHHAADLLMYRLSVAGAR